MPPGKGQPPCGRRVVALDAVAGGVTVADGARNTSGRVLLATGGDPRRLPFGGAAVNYYRTLADYRALRADADRGAGFVVIGGGFIGSEVAASLRKRGNDVTLVFPEAAICNRVFPARLGAYLNDTYREKGVEVLAESTVTDIEAGDSGATVTLGDGRRLAADRVVAGIGIEPDVTLARAAGLGVDNGILVDERLQTTQPGIYAAGDVANYPDAMLGMRRRVEHADAARAMGRAAGRNMAGAGEAYRYLPMFYSDLFELGYEAVGQCDSRLEVVEDWREEVQQGVVYYLQDGRGRGGLMIDVWEKGGEGREGIERGGGEDNTTLIGRISAR